jgi:hypothetical protein
VNVGEQLGLGGARVSAQQDIQLRAEVAASRLGKVLARAAKQLEQDPLLHVLVLIDGRSNSARQPLVDIRLLGQALEQRYALLSQLQLVVVVGVPQPVRLLLGKVDDVDVRLVDGHQIPRLGIGAVGDGAVHAGDGHPVPGHDLVHQLPVDKQHDGVRRLTRRHVVRTLLQLHHLLVGELAPVVDKPEAVVGVAVGAEHRLLDAAALHVRVGHVVTDGAAEPALRQLGNQIAGPDHHPRDGDQLIDVLGVEAAHVLRVIRVVRPHLDLMLQLGFGKPLEEHLVHRHVEGGDDLLGIGLAIKKPT